MLWLEYRRRISGESMLRLLSCQHDSHCHFLVQIVDDVINYESEEGGYCMLGRARSYGTANSAEIIAGDVELVSPCRLGSPCVILLQSNVLHGMIT